MWTNENRAKYDRDHLRYPSDLTDDEWALVEPFIPPAKPGGGKRRQDMRAVMNGVMYILRSGCQWRYLPKDFPPRSTVHGYFVWWHCDGTLTCNYNIIAPYKRFLGRLPTMRWCNVGYGRQQIANATQERARSRGNPTCIEALHL